MTTTVTAGDAVRVLERNWREDGGYTSPNLETYPWLWLWDSCFHAVLWGAVGDARGVRELATVLSLQHPDGLVPHMGYQLDPSAAEPLWGQVGASPITQPPMYAHAARRLQRSGWEIEPRLIDRIERALDALLERRGRDGLVAVYHPWESGCDDSPRWDAWAPAPFERGSWGERKRELVDALVVESGAAVGSTFAVRPAGFNALVAFNLSELAALTGSAAWRDRADELGAALDERWVGELRTWADAADGEPTSTRVRTLDALLPVLVTRNRNRAMTVLDALDDPAAYGAPFGPRGAHRDELAYDPGAYWRGSAWPQLDYLLALGAERWGRQDVRRVLAERTRSAAARTGHAEHWNPETGEGLGAAPQSWSVLWVLLAEPSQP